MVSVEGEELVPGRRFWRLHEGSRRQGEMSMAEEGRERAEQRERKHARNEQGCGSGAD
jgi:hypothetical protein